MPDEKTNGIDVDIGPLHLKKLPKACGPVLLVAVVIVCLVVTWARYGKDIYNPITKLEAAQLTESQRHFWEDPHDEVSLDDGQGVARHFSSDHCTAVQWFLPDGTSQTAFAFHPRRTREILAGPHPLNSIKGAGFGCGGPGPGCCLDPHPPPWREKVKPLNGCEVRVWRIFSDDCSHYQDMDNCRRMIGPLIWTRCYH